MSSMQGNWNYPNKIVAGAGRLRELAGICRDKSLVRPLVVTDPGLSSLPMFSSMLGMLASDGLEYVVFDCVDANPDETNVAQGLEAYAGGSCDGVIAFGGGSALDAGKAIALMVGQSRPMWDFEDVADNWLRVDPQGVASVIAIPTTAGTGSEVGRASVITDSLKHEKKIIFHPKMLPEVVILDPELTIGLPAHITAATGLDALSHCLEAFCSPSYHPMADGIALEGMRLIKENLCLAFRNGQDLEARMNMLVASSMGATAFQKGLGAMHAIAHSIGGLYGSHHGLLNAILMPYVLLENLSEVEEKLSRAARYLGLEGGDALAFIDWVNRIRDELEIPKSLGEIGIRYEDAPLLAQMAVNDPSAGGNPILFDVEAYERLIKSAISGMQAVMGGD